MKLRVAIVDDESLGRERLRRLLRADREVEIVAECPDGTEAVEAVQRHAPDLLLLDVQMPGMDGFDVLRALDPKHLPVVVFVTGFNEHAVRAFEARALDYLVKPASRARLEEALSRTRERLASRSAAFMSEQLLELLRERDGEMHVKRFLVRDGERTVFVAAGDVDWIESAGNYAILHVGKATHILRETMTALEAQLGRGNFLRVSRSAIVNLACVGELQTVTPAEHVAVLTSGQRILVTRCLREIEERMRFV